MLKVCVVIPVYKPLPSDSEITSLKQCLKILHKYDVFLLHPIGLNVAEYLKVGEAIKPMPFEKKYFDGLEGYNRLVLSPIFYFRFLPYKYLLIYQLDCYVFRDELEYWAGKNFDYIGAPFEVNDQIIRTYNSLLYSKNSWIKKAKKLLSKAQTNLTVGNGGLSLRKVFKFWIISVLFKPVIFRWLTNEDYFWGLFAPNFIPCFKVPTTKLARLFAIEQNCKFHYEKNGCLPFGCHAWEKYEPKFWEDFIHVEK